MTVVSKKLVKKHRIETDKVREFLQIPEDEIITSIQFGSMRVLGKIEPVFIELITEKPQSFEDPK